MKKKVVDDRLWIDNFIVVLVVQIIGQLYVLCTFFPYVISSMTRTMCFVLCPVYFDVIIGSVAVLSMKFLHVEFTSKTIALICIFGAIPSSVFTYILFKILVDKIGYFELKDFLQGFAIVPFLLFLAAVWVMNHSQDSRKLKKK